PTDHVTEAVTDEKGPSIEISPLTTKLGGPNNMYLNSQVQLSLHRNDLDAETWRLFLVCFDQARVSFTDTAGDSMPGFVSSSGFPPGDKLANYTFLTSANLKKTDPQSLRIEIATESRAIPLPLEFKDFPLPSP